MKHLIFTCLSILIFQFSKAQDTIITKLGENILAQVVSVNERDVDYRKVENPNGALLNLPKYKLASIHFEGGAKKVFNTMDSQLNKTSITSTSLDAQGQGRADAIAYYQGYKPAGTGTLIASLLSPLVGLIPAIACSSTTPKEANLEYPNAQIFKNPEYQNAYTRKAKKIKQGKVWMNWGIGLAANVVAVAILNSK